MKATGIVRRVDDLGRIVIPKEIRRTLRIREGDPLEIYTEKDGGQHTAAVQRRNGNEIEHCQIDIEQAHDIEDLRNGGGGG